MSRPDLLLKYFAGDKNAGDLASPYLLAKISGRPVTPIPLRELSKAQHYMGVGSTLAHAESNTVVWGTGIMKPTLSPRARPLHIIGVRGPLTRARLKDLGYGSVRVIGDCALNLPRYFRPSGAPRHNFGLIPHYVDEQEPFCDLCRQKGGLIISARQDLEPYLTQLLSCRLIISSSLHGLIFAHAYDLPAIWVRLSDRVVGEGFKFLDYYAFLGYQPGDIPRWDFGANFDRNMATADCPSIPTISREAPHMLYHDLVSRGHV